MPDQNTSIWKRPPKLPTDIKSVYDANSLPQGQIRQPLPAGTGIAVGGGQTTIFERPTPAAAAQAATPQPVRPITPPRLAPTTPIDNPLDLRRIPGKDIVTNARNLVDNMFATLKYVDAQKAQFAQQQAQAQSAVLGQGAPGGVMPGQVPQAPPPAIPGITGPVAPPSDVVTPQLAPTTPGAAPQVPAAQPPSALQQSGTADYTTKAVPLSLEDNKLLRATANKFRSDPDELFKLTNQFIEKYGLGKQADGRTAIEQLDADNPVRMFYEYYVANKTTDKTDTQIAEGFAGRKSATTIQSEKAATAKKAMDAEAAKINAAAQAKASKATTDQAKTDAKVLDASIDKILANQSLDRKQKDQQLSTLLNRWANKYPDMPMGKRATEAKGALDAGESYVAAKAKEQLSATQKSSLSGGVKNIVGGVKKKDADMTRDESRAAAKGQPAWLTKPMVPANTFDEYAAKNPKATPEQFAAEAYKGTKEFPGLKAGYAAFVERTKKFIKSQTSGPKNAAKQKMLLEVAEDIAREQWGQGLIEISSDLFDAWSAGDKAESPAQPAPAAGTPDYGRRNDGTQKGMGFLGPRRMKDGKVASEVAVGVKFDGKETEIPTLVPTLTQQEIDWILAGNDPRTNSDIMGKAIAHALPRLQAGKSPFIEGDEQPTLPAAGTQAPAKPAGGYVPPEVKSVPVAKTPAKPADYAAQRAATKEPVALAKIDETQIADIGTRIKAGAALGSPAVLAEIKAMPPSAARKLRQHLIDIGVLVVKSGTQE